MKIKTFLKIQAQNIFSIINCHNCVYTWRIFKRYIRELIHESWSLMIKFDQKFIGNKNSYKYKEQLISKIEKLYNKIEIYLPNNKNRGIAATFMHICKYVVQNHEQNILDSFNSMPDVYLQFNKIGFLSVQIGFKPFSLLTESGARVTYKNFKKMNYIKDPELKYEQKEPKTKKITLLSITQKIDDIFNSICQKNK